MRRLLVLILVAGSFVAFSPEVKAQTAQPPAGQPLRMRLCTDHCENLVWAGDHYDGIKVGETLPMSRYTVSQWKADGIVITGVNLKSNPQMPDIRAVFTGVIGPGTVERPQVEVFLNDVSKVQGASYQLTWETAPERGTRASSPGVTKSQTASTPPAPSHSTIPDPNLSEQTAQGAEGPKAMRLCNGGTCTNLIWVGDHYEGRLDGQTELSARFWVTSWQKDNVDFTGKTAKAVDGVFPAEGRFTGKISAAGNSVVDGSDQWRIGYSQGGTMPFTLTWGKQPPAPTPAPASSVSPNPMPSTQPRPAVLAKIGAPPQTMRVCTDVCYNLTAVGDHYDGSLDGQTQVSTRYWIKGWDADHIEFNGKTTNPVSGPYPLDGDFTGEFSPLSENIVQGRMNWRIGYAQAGQKQFILTWGKQLTNNTPEAVAALKLPPPIRASESNSIVDIETPDKNPPFVPLAVPPWHALPSVAGFDLNGIWEREATDHVERISVFQLRNQVAIRNVQGRQYSVPDGVLMFAEFHSAAEASGKLNKPIFDENWYTRWDPGTLKVSDAEHIQISDGSRYRRLTSTPFQDIPCDLKNPLHISGELAFAIGEIYSRDDRATANCWFYVGAKSGNLNAEANYGESLLNGNGIEKNVDAGVAWIQHAAIQGNTPAGFLLAQMFLNGLGVPLSLQRNEYWRQRVLGTSPLAMHDNDHNKLQPWMSDTSEPCDAKKPPHISADDALRKGRVAYEARVLQTAHCWFLVSAHLGEVRAYTFLGIMSAFGMGVQANPENGFAYLSLAAKDGRDPDAAIFLANYYRYGVGTPPDDNQARNEMQYAMNLPNGMNAFSRLEGSLVNKEATAWFMSGGYSPNQSCIQEQLRKPGGRTDNCYNAGDANRVAERNEGITDSLRAASEKTVIDNPEEIYPEAHYW